MNNIIKVGQYFYVERIHIRILSQNLWHWEIYLTAKDVMSNFARTMIVVQH